MKNIIYLFILFNVFSINAQSNSINYKALIKDGSGNIVVSQSIDIQFTIYQGPGEATNVYQESHTVNTDVNGIVILNIGEGTSMNVFSDINWALEDHYLNVQIDTGDGLTDMGTTKFATVPYTSAMGKWQSHKNGVTAKGTGGSIFIGDDAGQNDDFTYNFNIGIGNEALATNSTGHNNLAIGKSALFTNRDGVNNIALGNSSLFANISGVDNIAIGDQTLEDNTNGNNNFGAGESVLNKNITGSENVALGSFSMFYNTSGNNNVGLGNRSLLDNTEGEYNIATGYRALFNNTIGDNNIAIGKDAMLSNTIVSDNIAIGTESLKSNTSGTFNIAIGKQSLTSNTEGDGNVSLGYEALSQNVDGHFNTAMGYHALGSSIGSQWNTAIGGNALYDHISGGFNVAVGVNALSSHTDGTRNIGIGTAALILSQTGNENIGIGSNSGRENISGNNNMFLGIESGRNNTGSGNVFLGYNSGYNEAGSNKLYIENSNSSSPLVYGEFDNNILGFYANVGIGHKTPTVPLHVRGGSDVTLSNASGILVVGNEANVNLAIDNNEIQGRNNGVSSNILLQAEGGSVNIGNSVVIEGTVPIRSTGSDVTLSNGSGYLVLGNDSGHNVAFDNNEIQARNNGAVADLTLQYEGGKVITGSNLDVGNNLDVGFNAYIQESLFVEDGDIWLNGSVQHWSDKRLKRDIENISYGLDEILKLRPTEYFWKGKEQEHKSLGLIAQEVDEVIKNVVIYEENKDRFGVSYTELIPVLIKALQEQQDIINKQDKTIQGFESRLQALEGSLVGN